MTTTDAPATARIRVVASPIPPAPPAIAATLPRENPAPGRQPLHSRSCRVAASAAADPRWRCGAPARCARKRRCREARSECRARCGRRPRSPRRRPPTCRSSGCNSTSRLALLGGDVGPHVGRVHRLGPVRRRRGGSAELDVAAGPTVMLVLGNKRELVREVRDDVAPLVFVDVRAARRWCAWPSSCEGAVRTSRRSTRRRRRRSFRVRAMQVVEVVVLAVGVERDLPVRTGRGARGAR